MSHKKVTYPPRQIMLTIKIRTINNFECVVNLVWSHVLLMFVPTLAHDYPPLE